MNTSRFLSAHAAVLAVSLGTAATAQQQQSAAPTDAAPLAGLGFWSLDAFGQINTQEKASAAYEKAHETILAAGGGVLVIPGSAPATWKFSNNSQQMLRKPAAPEPAKSWSTGPGVTVIDTRGGTVKVHPPQVSGMKMERVFNLSEGQSAPHWDYYPMLTMNNNVVRGSTSYRDQLQLAVEAGNDRRFYVATIRGIFPGMFINAPGSKGVERLYVKSLGFDKEKKLHFFTANTNSDHKPGTYMDNKTHVNVIKMSTNAHNELQTFDLMNERHHYSQGDSYLYDARFFYMGDVHSTGGDENGVLYAAFTHSQTNIFRAVVEKVAPESNDVIFTKAQNTSTLGSGRPLINLNPKKAITGGVVNIVRPASYTATAEDEPWNKDPVFAGKSWPTTIHTNERSGSKELAMGGLIRGSKDAPWTADIVGRWFAVDDESELVGKKLRRWYRITSLVKNDNGTKDIKIERHWWGSKEAGSPTLYRDDNYSTDAAPKPLKYVITPGANVYDVAGGVTNERSQTFDGKPSPRLLKVAPYADRGTDFDFAAGDEIEQAIGPDPFKPTPFRSWTFDAIPSSFPSPIFDVANHGVPRSTVLAVAGGTPDGPPAFDSIINVKATARNVIHFSGDLTNAAIEIAQPKHSAPIVWRYDEGKKEARMTVDNRTGRLTYEGGPIQSDAGITALGGISGTDVAARNLRGVAVPVTAGVKTIIVKFPRAEADENYAVFIETNWLSQRAITVRTAEGFTVTFATEAPKNAILDWTLVR